MSTHIHTPGEILINRYKVVKYVDEGGMQQVYLATDLTLGRQVALKVPKTSSAEKRFARSARMSARVNHANVAKTLDYFETSNRSYLIEEYVDGHHLGWYLTESFDYLDPHLGAYLLQSLSKALAASHHAKVLHRDLKPSNIMVSGEPSLHTVKITDFGIAKMAEEEFAQVNMDDESSITGSDTVLGALPYMAPEMVERSKDAKLPADVWAVGAIMYKALTGQFPFGSGLKSVAAILEAKIPAKPQLFEKKLQFAALGEDLWGIITSCLRKDPAQRPTADELEKMCSKLCYSDAIRSEGQIITYKDSYGAFGKILGNSGEMVFFHSDSFYGKKPKVGQRVNFACYPGTPLPRAFPILPLKSDEI